MELIRTKFIALFVLTILLLSLTITPVKADTSVPNAKIDFGSDASAVLAGWTRLGATNAYASGVGYGWTDSSESAVSLANVDRGSGSGGALDDLEQDIHYTGAERWFKINLPNGVYKWTLYYGDNGYAHGPFDIDDNAGHVVDGLSTTASQWKSYSGTTTVSDGKLYIKIKNVNNNPAFNGIEWLSDSYTTTTSYVKSTTIATTTITATSTVTLGTSLVTSTKTGGSSTEGVTCSTTSGAGGTTILVIITQVLSSSVSVLVSITNPAAGTLTGYETTTITCSSTTTLGSLITTTQSETTCLTESFTDTLSETSCLTETYTNTLSETECITETFTDSFSETYSETETFTESFSETYLETLTISETECSTLYFTSTVDGGTITETSTSIKTITGYITSTSSSPVITVTVDGTSTSTDITATVTQVTSTAIRGVIGDSCTMCLPLIILLILLSIGYIVIRKRN